MKKILIIGAGKIAEEYIKVINFNKKLFVSSIFSRTYGKAKKLSQKYNIKTIFSNRRNILEKKHLFDGIIIAINIENNHEMLKFCLPLKKKILIEKPLALNFKQNIKLDRLKNNLKKNIFIGLNRRFFGSTIYLKKNLPTLFKQKRLIEVYDCQNEKFFDKKKFPQVVRKNLMYANSIHLIDYFNIFCRGKIIETYVTKKKINKFNFLSSVLKFSSGDVGYYYCDLNYSSKWKIRVCTENEAWTMSPLEKIHYENYKSKKNFSLSFKTNFKDGFYNQVDNFQRILNNKKNSLVNISSYFNTIRMIHKIYGK